jgi:uncharacterized protein (AIM24 family)
MSLLTRLRLAITALTGGRITPQTFGDGFDVLLTQDDDAIITQSSIFLVRQTVQYNVITQDMFMITAQDGRTIQVGF